jgi:hypothetical protein
VKLLIFIILVFACLKSVAYAYEGQRSNSILLNGVWEFALGDGNEGAELPKEQTRLEWQKANLPGPFMKWNQDAVNNIKLVWVKRQFQVSDDQAQSMAVLRWNHIAFGAIAFINGQKVGQNEPMGPYQVIIPEGVLKPGKNEIVLKVAGSQGVRRAKSGYFLIPAGFSSSGGMPEIADDIWIDFADKVYMKWVLAIPDLENSKVSIRVTLTGIESVSDLQILAEVRPYPDGEIIGKGEADVEFIPDPDTLGDKHFFVDVPMPDFKPWTYEECNLYNADVKITKDGEILDTLRFRFGMREIKAILVPPSNGRTDNGKYKLNGKNLWLRGSNLVFEWNWGNIITGKEKDYLVTEAREMSMNSFRTHTQPPPALWANICDEYGTMILAEFPVLYNYADYKFTPEEYKIWHKNVLLDATGWMARLWNHPAVIMWVLSNESNLDNKWEEGTYQDFVNSLDPTRPTMRTGTTGTKENYDIHACGNITETAEGSLMTYIQGWFNEAKGKVLTNSEYMNTFGPMSEQWTGKNDEKSLAYALAYAQLGMEHTEAMRRARISGLLPYMYAGWTKTRTGQEWKAGFAKPVSACWHSSLSPVLASLDLFDPNYLTSQEVTTDLYLINDSWHDASIHVDLLLTKDCPEFIPEAECFNDPIAKWSYDFQIKADSITNTPITWKLPDKEGNYWLTARTTGIEGRPVLSQRFVRAIQPPTIPDLAKKRNFVILGGDSNALDYFRSKGLRTSNSLDDLKPDKDIVIIWNTEKLNETERQKAQALCDFANAGGRVIVLSTYSWDWRELCDVSIEKSGPFSRVFAYEGITHPILTGIDPEWLIRWNGLPGTVAVAEIKGTAMKNAKAVLWGSKPASIVLAEIPVTYGKGKILFSQLNIQKHIDDSKPDYDPIAERILLNLIGH